MTIFLLAIAILILNKLKFVKKGINKDYISSNNTKIINGIFVLLVLLSHSIPYITWSDSLTDSIGLFVISNIAQLMVTTFFFYSGYGIFESIKSKKQQYINSMPKKRILNTLIKFDIAIFLFFIVSNFLGIKYNLKTILLSLIGWSAVGNSNWYIFIILCLYLITYISFNCFKNKSDITKINLVLIIAIVFIFVIKEFKEPWWYNTMLCYPFGMYFSYYKKIIESKLKNNKNYIICLICILIIFLISLLFRKNVCVHSTIHVISFVLLVVLFSMKVVLNSKILAFMGMNVFYIYIYQRIPMMILQGHNINKYVFIILIFIITLSIGKLISYFEDKLFKKIKL